MPMSSERATDVMNISIGRRGVLSKLLSDPFKYGPMEHTKAYVTAVERMPLHTRPDAPPMHAVL